MIQKKNVLSLAEFQKHQQETRRCYLSYLLRDCCEKYLKAAELVNLWGDDFYDISAAWRKGSVDISPLFPFYEDLSVAYRQQLFPQSSIFEDDEVRWSVFFYWNFGPRLIRNDQFVRSLLISVGLLSSKIKRDHRSLLLDYIPEMLTANETVFEPQGSDY
jgi:hypothetical protein